MCVQFKGGNVKQKSIKTKERKAFKAKISKEMLKSGDKDFVDERIIRIKEQSWLDKTIDWLLKYNYKA